MSVLKACLTAIPDPRRPQGRMYDLPHLLLFSILAVASGATSYRKIHQFIATHWQRLNSAFECHWRQAPAYTSIRYALPGLEAEEVEQAFRTHAAALAGKPLTKRPCIALDGKTLRGSLDRFEDKKAAQRLIRELGLTGQLYTLDALHLQKTPSSKSVKPATTCSCN
jgi:hypothetical protein